MWARYMENKVCVLFDKNVIRGKNSQRREGKEMKRLVVFGIGYQCKKILEGGLLDSYHIVAFVDNDKNRWGEVIAGEKIISPKEGLKQDFDKVLIMTTTYAAEIYAQLIESFSIPKEMIISLGDLLYNLYTEVYNEGFLFMLHHCPSNYVPAAILSDGEKTTSDISLVDRIIEAYHRTLEHSKESGESWWTTGWIWDCKEDIHKKLLSGNRDEVKNILRNPATNNLFWGFESIAANQTLKDADKKKIARLIYDNIVQLAAYLGVVRMPNPEANDFTPKMNLDDVFDKISAKYGFDLKFPNPYPGELGIPTKRGIVGYRTVQALYQAIKIHELVNENNNDVKVLEIGAGLGRTAYFAYQMGIKNYTILDIPMTNVAQEYFLGRTIGEECVAFVGEGFANEIKILPSYMLQELEEEKYDLILNVDSMTEMDEDSQKNYWKYIQTHTNIFLSINHEANTHMVRELYLDTDFKVHRRICPMRRGYIEEEVFLN